MGFSNGDGDGGGVDGDGSGGNSLSRQGAGTEASMPRISYLVAAALQNFSWNSDLIPRVFSGRCIYRRRGGVGGGSRGAHPREVPPLTVPGPGVDALGCAPSPS